MLKDAAQKGQTKVVMEKGEYLIQCDWKDRYGNPNDGLFIPSDMEVDFSGSTLRLSPTYSECSSVISFNNVQNSTIKNATIIGDRENHQYVAGKTNEFGFGVSVNGGKNIKLQNVTIQDTIGDGVILHSYFATNPVMCDNVLVEGCTSTTAGVTESAS
jgi:hypothetical protein